MRKKRELTEGVFFHVTSRTNDKIRVFENKLGRKIMLIALQDAKDKYRFRLTNFCVMPTHFHLLIRPKEGTYLSRIIQWIKTRSAKHWNQIHGSTDHMWGERYFARSIKNFAIPVFSRKAPKSINRKIKVALTPIGTPIMPSVV